MNALRFVALFLVLLSSAWGQELKEVNWERGGLVVRGEQVFVVFEGQQGTEEHLLANVVLAIDSATFAEFKYKIEIVDKVETLFENETKTQVLSQRLLGMRNAPAQNRPLNGVGVVRIRVQDGSIRLVFAVAGKVYFAGRGIDGAIFQTRADALEQGNWKLSAYGELQNQLSLFPNETALVKVSENRFAMPIFDNRSGTLRVEGLRLAEAHEAIRLEHHSSVLSVLPATFETGKPFAAGGEISFAESEDPQSFQLILKNGETLTFGENSKAAKKKKNAREARSDYKSSTRIHWAVGSKSIAEYGEKLRQNTAPNFAIDVTDTVARWVEQARSADTPKNRSNSRTQTSKNMMSITASHELLSRFPEMRGAIIEATANAVAASEATQQNATMTFYLRLMDWPDRTQLTNALSAIHMQLNTFRQSRSFGEAYIIVDMLDVESRGVQYSTRSDVMTLLNQYISHNIGDFGIREIILEAPGAPDVNLVRGKPYAELVAIDSLIPIAGRAEIISAALVEHGTKLDAATTAEILQAFEVDGKLAKSEMENLDRFVEKLATVLPHVKLEPGDKGFASAVTTTYLRLTGDRQVGPFSPEVLKRVREIPRLLSSSYPGHLPNALTGRDWILRTFEQKLVSWLGYGYKRRPVKPILLLGDHGTGKTTMALNAGKAMGAAVELVNMSATVKPRSSYYFDEREKSGDNFDMKAVEEAVEKLVLDPNPVKYLVLDEIHATPGILNALLPAFGDGDRRAPGVLNLDGIIVVMIMNVQTDNDVYKNLSKLEPAQVEYPQHVYELAKLSLGGERGAVSPLVLGALSGRLMSDMMFFPALGVDRDQQNSLMEQSIVRFEQENKIRLVPQDAAIEYLKKVAASYTGGNYRSVERVLDEAITSAIGRWIAENPGRELKGYYVLGASKDRDLPASLKLLAVEGDEVGMEAVVSDTFNRYAAVVDSALSYAAETMAEGEGSLAAASRRNYELMRLGFRLASKSKPWKSAEAAKLFDEVPMPAKLNPNQQAEARKYLAQGAKAVFEQLADYKSGSHDIKDKDSLVRVSGQINQIFITLARLYRIERESLQGRESSPQGQSGTVAAWVEKISQIFNSEQVKPGSIEALAIAAGYLADELGRRTANAMFSDLSKNSRDEVLLRPASQASSSGADASAECQRLLMEAQLRASDLDKILGK